MVAVHPRRTGARRGTRRRSQVAPTRWRSAPASAHPGRRTAQALGRRRMGQNQPPNGRAVRGRIDRGNAALVDTHVSAHNNAREPRRLTRSPTATKALEDGREGRLIRADPSGRHDDSDGYGGIGATTSLAGRIGANTGHMDAIACRATQASSCCPGSLWTTTVATCHAKCSTFSVPLQWCCQTAWAAPASHVHGDRQY